jgi:acylphosphatase
MRRRVGCGKVAGEDGEEPVKSGEQKMGIRRLSAKFEGQVQGVGFRFTTVRIAQSFDITGRVRNEFDGSVSVVAEGEEAVLLRFVRSLKSTHLGRCITGESFTWSPATGEFAGFTVSFEL